LRPTGAAHCFRADAGGSCGLGGWAAPAEYAANGFR
jgi:hypothetical protein